MLTSPRQRAQRWGRRADSKQVRRVHHRRGFPNGRGPTCHFESLDCERPSLRSFRGTHVAKRRWNGIGAVKKTLSIVLIVLIGWSNNTHLDPKGGTGHFLCALLPSPAGERSQMSRILQANIAVFSVSLPFHPPTQRGNLRQTIQTKHTNHHQLISVKEACVWPETHYRSKVWDHLEMTLFSKESIVFFNKDNIKLIRNTLSTLLMW